MLSPEGWALFHTAMPLWLVSLIAGALIPWALLRERRLAPVDVPGQHSSHTRPTARGGGLGIALAMLGALIGTMLGSQFAGNALDALWLSLGVVLVAGIGAWDDYANLPRWPRLLAHAVAAALAVTALRLDLISWWHAIAAFGLIVWSINLHNFMDGANGLLAQQAIFVGIALAICGLNGEAATLANVAGAMAVATLGFLPFNFPRARIFLGDVGSGTIGLGIGVATLWAWRMQLLPAPAALILVSSFVVDASLTLISRMLRGRRWYTRHREHLYQWLVRAGWSHARVSLTYAAWNLWLVLPTFLAARHLRDTWAWALMVAVYLTSSAVWYVGKRSVLNALRTKA